MSRSLRWRVAVVDDREHSRAALRSAVWTAGGEVVGEATRCRDAVGTVTRSAADVVVVAVGLPDGDGVDAAADVMAMADVPVVLCTSRTGAELARRANAAGVMAYLLKPLRAATLAPTLDIAVARFRECRRLRRSLVDIAPRGARLGEGGGDAAAPALTS